MANPCKIRLFWGESGTVAPSARPLVCFGIRFCFYAERKGFEAYSFSIGFPFSHSSTNSELKNMGEPFRIPYEMCSGTFLLSCIRSLHSLTAERKGFEPLVGCPTHAFQACRLNHSRISPLTPNNHTRYLNKLKVHILPHFFCVSLRGILDCHVRVLSLQEQYTFHILITKRSRSFIWVPTQISTRKDTQKYCHIILQRDNRNVK